MFFKTSSLKKNQIKKDWFLIDANQLVVGRLASQIAIMLMGKHKSVYTPHLDCGDNVVVINSDKLLFTGAKMQNKIYYRHTGYPGGIKSITPEKMIEKSKSDLILKNAVRRMLGDGPLARQRLSNLYIYRDDKHKHEAQQPLILDIAKLSINSGNKNEKR